jgi:hypothetical protein
MNPSRTPEARKVLVKAGFLLLVRKALWPAELYALQQGTDATGTPPAGFVSANRGAEPSHAYTNLRGRAGSGQSPVAPSMLSRRRSAWPA